MEEKLRKTILKATLGCNPKENDCECYIESEIGLQNIIDRRIVCRRPFKLSNL